MTKETAIVSASPINSIERFCKDPFNFSNNILSPPFDTVWKQTQLKTPSPMTER